MAGMNALWAGIAATVTLGAVAGETAAALKVENQTKRREAEQFKKAFDRLVELQKQGDISTEELLLRVDEMSQGLSADFRKSIQEATTKGIMAIQQRTDAALAGINTQLEFAKENADRTETKEIERLQDEMNEMRKGLEVTQEKTRTSLIQRGIVGASAVAALNKAQQIHSFAVTRANKLSGQLRSDINFGLNRAIDQANLQQKQLGLQSGAQESDLQAGAGRQIAQTELGIKSDAFRQKEAARLANQQRSDALESQKIEFGFKTEADTKTQAQIDAEAIATGFKTSAEVFGSSV